MDKQLIEIDLSSIITVITVLVSVVVTLAGCIIYLYKKSEINSKEYSKQVLDLTKSFVESTREHARLLENNNRALENNTEVIDKLPAQFILQLRANIRNLD